jgi:GNAT superfamily N-acetyltransferase
LFKDHHYLSEQINKAARCYIGVWDDKVVAFASSITQPSGTLKNAWREHRTVVLPEYQSMGIGTRFSDAIAQIHIDQGHRYFSRSSHPVFIRYRTNSPLWKTTSKHLKKRTDVSNEKPFNNHIVDNKRICGSFEYIGLKKI